MLHNLYKVNGEYKEEWELDPESRFDDCAEADPDLRLKYIKEGCDLFNSMYIAHFLKGSTKKGDQNGPTEV